MNFISYLVNIFEYIFIKHLDTTSFGLALFSISLAYWFWKNPIDTNSKNRVVFYDKYRNINYIVYEDNKGWNAKKINKKSVNERESGERIFFLASIENNPGVKTAPTTIEELEKLDYK